jgi:ABC-type phosphate transport system substrate-binding protein
LNPHACFSWWRAALDGVGAAWSAAVSTLETAAALGAASAVSGAAMLTSLAALAAAPPARAETAVIVNVRNTLARMPAEQAAQFFLGRSTLLTPVDLAESSPVRADFYRKVAGKDQDQVKAIWSKIVFTGKGLPPREYNTPAEVKRAVAADPAAIGYIDRSAVDDTVKVILILQ